MALTKVKINLGTEGNLSGSRSIIQSTKTLVSSSAQLATDISGSFTAASSSFSTRVTTMEGSGTAQGVGTSDSPTFNNITATGTVTAQEFHSEFVSASITFTSGSHKFGDTSDDVHSMTGSLNVSGAINLNDGDLIVTDNIGIGDTSPPTTLTVNKSGTDGFTSETDAIRLLGNNGALGYRQSIGWIDNNTRSHATVQIGYVGQDGGGAGYGHFFVATSPSAAVEAPTERMRIDSSGNVGIGETSADGKLHVKQSTDDGNAIVVDSGTDGGRIDVLTVQEAGNERWNLSFEGNSSTNDLTLNSNSTNNILNIKPGGNVGIGTTSPGHLLTVAGATDGDYPSIHIIAHSSDSGSIWFGESATNKNGGIEYDNSGQDMYFTTNSSRKMTLDTSGNLGIGEISPSERLHIGGDYADFRLYSRTGIEIGTLAFNEYYNGSAWVNDDSDIVSGAVRFSDSRDSLEFGVRAGGSGAGYSTSHMVIRSTGRVGIGTNDPGYLTELRVNDTVVNTPRLVIRQLGAGDSSLAFQLPNSPYGWVMGGDNSDSDRFKISTGVGDLDSSPRFEIDPGGTTIHRYTGAENTVQIHSGVGSSTTGVSQIYFSSKDQYGGNTHQSYIKSTIDGSSSTPATKMSFHNRDSGGTVQEYLTIQADGDVALTNSLLMAGGSASRIKFNDRRVLEGATNGSLVRISEDFTATTIYGKVGINETSPETSAGLTINQGGNDDKILSLKTTDLAHGVTNYGETDTFGYMKKFSNTQGGLEIGGMTTHERPIVMKAFGNYYQSPGNGTGTDKCASQIWAYEISGTGVTNIGSNESIFTVRGYKGGSMQSVFIVDIEGDLHTDGSTSLTGYDYAEYFEWTDGNPDNEDRVGYSVVLEGDKIRKATEGETPIGIISGTPAVVGDNPMSWHGAWKTDEWGRKIPKEVAFVRWEYDYQSEEGAEVVKQEQNWKVSDLPEDLEIPDNAEYYTKLEGQYSDDYDPSQSYTLREYRQEWSAVGLMGKLRLRKGQPVASTWIKMRDEGNNIEMWLVK